MPWSWKLVRISGIDVYIHATFLMVIAWIALIHWNESQSMAAVIEGVGFILALFACVVQRAAVSYVDACEHAGRRSRFAVDWLTAGLSGGLQRAGRRHADTKRPRQRLASPRESCARRRPQQRIRVVSHAGTLRVFRYLLERSSHDEFIERWVSEHVPNCAVTSLVLIDF